MLVILEHLRFEHYEWTTAGHSVVVRAVWDFHQSSFHRGIENRVYRCSNAPVSLECHLYSVACIARLHPQARCTLSLAGPPLRRLARSPRLGATQLRRVPAARSVS